MSDMIFKYYEVTAFKPRLDYKKNTYHESESLGFFSTKEKAEQKLKDWCTSKGIFFDDHYYLLNEENVVRLDDTAALISVAGVFFNVNDMPVKYKDNWDYGSYAAVTEKELILDVGE